MMWSGKQQQRSGVPDLVSRPRRHCSKRQQLRQCWWSARTRSLLARCVDAQKAYISLRCRCGTCIPCSFRCAMRGCRSRQAGACHGSTAATASLPPAPSLLPALQLREVLKSGGPTALMTRLYRDYLQVGAQCCDSSFALTMHWAWCSLARQLICHMCMRAELARPPCLAIPLSPVQYKLEGGAKGARRAAGAAPPDPGQPGGGGGGGSEAPPSARMMGGYKPGEEQALLKEAKSMAGPAAAAAAAAAQRAGRGGRGGRAGHGGGRGGRGRGRKGGKSEDAAAAAAALAVASTTGRGHQESPPPPAHGGDASQHAAASAAAGEEAADGQAGQASEEHPLLAGVEFLALETHGFMRLWEAQPAWVVMYDPDVAFTRQLELYKASRWAQRLVGLLPLDCWSFAHAGFAHTCHHHNGRVAPFIRLPASAQPPPYPFPWASPAARHLPEQRTTYILFLLCTCSAGPASPSASTCCATTTHLRWTATRRRWCGNGRRVMGADGGWSDDAECCLQCWPWHLSAVASLGVAFLSCCFSCTQLLLDPTCLSLLPCRCLSS